MEDLLLELFPEIQINETMRMPEGYFSIRFENKWFHFPPNTISEREKILLHQIIMDETVDEKPQNHIWAQFLLEGSANIPSDYEEVQLLQFILKLSAEEEKNFDQKLWLDAFKNTFSFIKEGFFVNNHYGVVILNNPTHIELQQEIDGVLNVLDDDFSIRSSVYLGQNWSVNKNLPLIFAEEQKIFRNNHASTKRSKISQLPEIALLHYSQATALNSPILHHLKEKIKTVDGGPDLVISMWNNQGNISKAAAELYVHRNTFQYRLDRFFDIVGLNLKNMDDLLLGYLASISRTDEH